MIKFVSRPNFIYFLQLIIWNEIRRIEKIIMSEVLGFTNSSIFIPLMFIGEFLGGFIIIWQTEFVSNSKRMKQA